MKVDKNLVIPTLHLNGTSPQELLDQIETAHGAVDAAISALRKAAPHGRDYYVQPMVDGVDAIQVAIQQHCDRLNRLESVLAELSEISSRILDAAHRRERHVR